MRRDSVEIPTKQFRLRFGNSQFRMRHLHVALLQVLLRHPTPLEADARNKRLGDPLRQHRP